MKRDAPLPPICKVTTQYRSGNSFVYELESAGVLLAVHISPGATAESNAGWRVALHNGRSADALVIAESATTRTEALRRVALSWSERAPELGLTEFDWKAVTEALLAIRAI
jgi:hypothetical protein